jgi:hypothetical protein
MAWRCAICDTEHEEAPLCYGASPPWLELVPSEERAARVLANAGSRFFVRGHLEIPLLRRDEVFAWAVWVELDRESFDRIDARWDAPARVGDRATGVLASALPYEPPTRDLPCTLTSRELGSVPLVQLSGAEHPLAMEQARGMTQARVQELAHLLLHR